ncbi:hypothetical protein IFM89_018813 [Coptis chinensis]|uniref:RNase H type-1 domain-containing protein n=1 Tax=Coptis chinensis TaxID=261450 RepID=A0A835GZN7_9MAGN|nr:hypothetical protein IFM89_018813 [Coptis chinensis]
MKLNTDGVAFGNPGPSGIGVTFRDFEGSFKLSLCQNIGNGSNFRAECLAILEGVELAIRKGWVMLWIEADSEPAIKAFCNDSLLWELQPRMEKLLHYTSGFHFHIDF